MKPGLAGAVVGCGVGASGSGGGLCACANEAAAKAADRHKVESVRESQFIVIILIFCSRGR